MRARWLILLAALLLTSALHADGVQNPPTSAAPSGSAGGDLTGTYPNPTIAKLNGQAYTAAGSWTPADNSGASLVFTGVSASYTQIGNMVFAYAQLTYPSTANGANASISGLPVTVANQNYAQQCNVSYSTASTLIHSLSGKNSGVITLYTSAGVGVTNTQMSLAQLNIMCIYPAS